MEKSSDALKSGTNPPPSQDTVPGYLSSIWEKLQVDSFSVEMIEIILSSWRTGTLAQYQGVYKKWYEFCKKKIYSHHQQNTLFTEFFPHIIKTK